MFQNISKLIFTLFLNLFFVLAFSFSNNTLAQMTSTDFMNQGMGFLSNDDYSNAIQSFNEALKIDSTNTKASYNKALAYYYLKDYKLSIEVLNGIIDLKPFDADSWHLKGIIFYEKGLLDESLLCLEKASSYNKINKNFISSKCSVLYELNKTDEAKKCFESIK